MKHKELSITPFAQLEHLPMKPNPDSNHKHFGLTFVDDKLSQRAHMRDAAPKSPAAMIASSLKATRNKSRCCKIKQESMWWGCQRCTRSFTGIGN